MPSSSPFFFPPPPPFSSARCHEQATRHASHTTVCVCAGFTYITVEINDFFDVAFRAASAKDIARFTFPRAIRCENLWFRVARQLEARVCLGHTASPVAHGCLTSPRTRVLSVMRGADEVKATVLGPPVAVSARKHRLQGSCNRTRHRQGEECDDTHGEL